MPILTNKLLLTITFVHFIAKSASNTSPKHSNCLQDDDNDGFLQYNSQLSDNNQENETDEHNEQEHEQLLEVPAIKDTSQVHEEITSVLSESSSHNEGNYYWKLDVL